MKLPELPSDIRVLILSHLDFPSLSHLVRTHSSLNSVWKSYPEHLSRAICIRNGLADSKTLSAAAPLQAEGWHKRGGLEKEPSEEELKDVIREQRSMTGAFDGVKSWKEYAQVRLGIDRKWKKGASEGSRILFQFTGVAEQFASVGFWNFKLDPISKWYVGTGYQGENHFLYCSMSNTADVGGALTGGIFAFDKTGQLVWYSLVPGQRQGHLELTYDDSASYISVNYGRQAFLVWKLHDPSSTFETSPPSLPLNLPNHVQAALANRFRSLDSSGKGFYPYCWLEAPSPFQATKLRFPQFICSSEDSRTISIWNIKEPQTSRTDVDIGTRFIDQLEEEEVLYLDFDSENVFVAGKKSIVVFKPAFSQDGDIMKYQTTWPPSMTPQESLSTPASSTHYRQFSTNLNWTAVHHDSKSNHLCAITPETVFAPSKLLWTCDYNRTIWSGNSEEIKQKTVVLVVEGDGNTRLSVENDRVSFVAAKRGVTALITIQLRSFSTLDGFAADAPQPVCLNYPLFFSRGPLTIESSSTDTYLPHQIDLSKDSRFPEVASAITRYSSLWKQFSRSLPFAMRWESLDGRVLKDYEGESLTESEALELLNAWSNVYDTIQNNFVNLVRTDGIIGY